MLTEAYKRLQEQAIIVESSCPVDRISAVPQEDD